MPNVTVYIRNEDIDKWRALKDKSETISRLLNTQTMPPIYIDEAINLTDKQIKKLEKMTLPHNSAIKIQSTKPGSNHFFDDPTYIDMEEPA